VPDAEAGDHAGQAQERVTWLIAKVAEQGPHGEELRVIPPVRPRSSKAPGFRRRTRVYVYSCLVGS
jgi:hypothetical protein